MASVKADIGDMDRRVTILRNVATGTAPDGEPLEDWQPLATVAGMKRDIRGREYFASQQLNTERTTRWVIRWRSDVDEKMRLSHAGVTYDIRAIIELGRKARLEIMCTARPPLNA